MSPAPEQKDESPRRSLHQNIGLVLGPALFLAVAFIPSGLHRIEGQGSRPAFAAGIALLMATWWFTEAVPIAWTAAAPLLLFPALNVFGTGLAPSALRTVEPYVDPYIFLFLGGMAIGAAMEQWNLHRRLALHIMRKIGTGPPRLLFGLLVATATVSMWISNTATAVMMLPIAIALLREMESQGGRKLHAFGAALMLAVAYGANVGGIATKIGTPPNAIFAGYAMEKLGYEVGFLHFMALGVPFVALFIPIVWAVLWRMGRLDQLSTTPAKDVLDRELRALGTPSRGEKAVAVVFALAAALWILSGPLRDVLAAPVAAALDGFKLREKHVESSIAVTAALALVLLRALSMQSLRRIPWDSLILLGGSFALAAGIEGSGLSRWIALQLSGLGEMGLFQQLLVASAATVLLSAIASNTATTNVLLNVLPRSVTLLSISTLAASCDFALPAGTPPNAIVFGSGRVRLPVMMKVGAVLDVLAVLALTLYGFAYARHLFPS